MPKIQVTHDCFIITMLTTMVLAALSLLLLSKFVEGEVVVDTKLGSVRGSLMKTRLGKTVYSFRGLHYAEPPTGPLRFKNPVPVKPWNGTLDLTKEAPACPQHKGVLRKENCLTLNIYTKKLKNETGQLPVIVYIHAGSYYEYSSQSFLYSPYYLLDQDIVLVTFNYRLGTLGFLSTGDAFAPGNMAFKDQVEVLRFVQKHIDMFGGNPDSVTLTGQSAGSRSIILHMLSKMSTGLFHRGIAHSGSPLTLIPTRKDQLTVAKKQAKLINCPTDVREEMYRCLMEKPADDFGKTVESFHVFHDMPNLIWYPAIEPKILGGNTFLTDDPMKLIKSGKIANPVPLIMGTTKNEYTYLINEIIESAVLNGNDTEIKKLDDNWDELAPYCLDYERDTKRSKIISEELRKFYFGNKSISSDNYNDLRHVMADANGHYPIYRAVRLLAEHSPAPVYFFEFSYLSPDINSKWKKYKGEVSHADDMQFLFPLSNDVYIMLKNYPTYNSSDPEIFMVERLTGIWANFAKTGNPLPDNPQLFGNVIWEPFTTEKRAYINIDEKLTLKTDYLRDTMAFWDKLFP